MADWELSRSKLIHSLQMNSNKNSSKHTSIQIKIPQPEENTLKQCLSQASNLRMIFWNWPILKFLRTRKKSALRWPRVNLGSGSKNISDAWNVNKFSPWFIQQLVRFRLLHSKYEMFFRDTRIKKKTASFRSNITPINYFLLFFYRGK